MLFQYEPLGRTQWLRGRIDEARENYDRLCATSHSRQIPDANLTRELLRAMLAISDRRYAAAEDALHQLAAIQQKMRHTILCGNARLLLAHLYLLQNRPREALSELAPVLADHERLGASGLLPVDGAIARPLLRLAVEHKVSAGFASHLLGILDAGRQRPLPIPGTADTLTSREAEVLHLVAAGAGNREIAEKLVITERTAKAHVTGILGKLRVSSRTQAIARARELRLI